MKRVRQLLRIVGLLVIMSACEVEPEIIQPEDIIDLNDNTPHEQRDDRRDHVVFETIEGDLFYLDETLKQYKLSDQVNYFDYSEVGQVLSIQKTTGQWIVWHLENQKPTIIEQAKQVVPVANSRDIYYTGANGKGLFKLTDDKVVQFRDIEIERLEVSLDGEFVLAFGTDKTLMIFDENGRELYQKQKLLAYHFDQESQAVTLWVDEMIYVLELYQNQVRTFKVLYGVTDWLNAPDFSDDFETFAHFSELDLESGVGELTINSNFHKNEMIVPQVISYEVSSSGKEVYYVTDKLELYVLDFETNQHYFIGKQNEHFNLSLFIKSATYRSDEGLFHVNEQYQSTLISESVYQFDATDEAIVYIDDLNDLYVVYQGLSSKVAESVERFSLGENGVFYHQGEQIVYYRFDGTNEVMLDELEHYEWVFHENNELYRATLTDEQLIGTWACDDPKQDIRYVFNEDLTFTIEEKQGKESVLTTGTYHVMNTPHGGLNVFLSLNLSESRYLSLQRIDNDTLQISENEKVMTLEKQK